MPHTQLGEGWAQFNNARKAHYFVAGRSLCGKWMKTWRGGFSNAYWNEDKCKPCERRLDKRSKAEKDA